MNQLNKALNKLSKDIGAKKKAKENADELMAEVAKTKGELTKKEEHLKELKQQINQRLRMVGNIVHESVPVSRDEKDNVISKVVKRTALARNARGAPLQHVAGRCSHVACLCVPRC